MHVVLSRGDAVCPVREGDTLEGGYRVESIAPDRVTLIRPSELRVSALSLKGAAGRAIAHQRPARPGKHSAVLTGDETLTIIDI